MTVSGTSIGDGVTGGCATAIGYQDVTASYYFSSPGTYTFQAQQPLYGPKTATIQVTP